MRRVFTDEQVAFVREHWEEMSDARIADEIASTAYRVKNLRHRLGLQRSRRTRGDIARLMVGLEECAASGYSSEEAAAELGISKTLVGKLAASAGTTYRKMLDVYGYPARKRKVLVANGQK